MYTGCGLGIYFEKNVSSIYKYYINIELFMWDIFIFTIRNKEK